MSKNAKIGLYGIGLDTYWDQFEGLKDNLLGYQATVRSRLESFGAEVVDVGLIDEPVAAKAAGERFRTENVEAIFLFITTYALSSTVLPVVQRAGVPVIVLNLQPVAQLDYECGRGPGRDRAFRGAVRCVGRVRSRRTGARSPDIGRASPAGRGA